jgi:hypothetical protein
MPLKSVLTRRSIGKLDLGSIAHRVDDSDSHDWHCFPGLRDREDPVRLESLNRLSLRRLFVIGLIGVVGLLLAAPHGTETALRAVAYWRLGALNSPGEAILYSVDSIITRGAPGLMLESHWRLPGALKATDGLLLFGNQHGLHFHGNASLPGGHDPISSSCTLIARPRAD